jgi:hypothetical protein
MDASFLPGGYNIIRYFVQYIKQKITYSKFKPANIRGRKDGIDN